MSTLNVLMISGDRAVFDPKSSVSQRVRSYSKQVGNLTLIVPTHTSLSREEGTLHIYSAPYRLRVLRFWQVVMLGEKLSRPDIVTAQDPFFLGLAAWFIARHHQVPLELQVHTDVLDPAFRTWSLENRLRVFLARILLPRATSVRVVSERIARSLVREKILSRAQISVLPIPLTQHEPNLEEVRSLRARFSPHDFLILTVARLAPEKRIDLMLQALALVHQEGFSFQFIIVGDGEVRRVLENQARKLGISERVHFIGSVSDPSPYYKIVHCYLSLSVYEGYGLSLAEAARARLPIISTDAGIASLLGAHLVAPNPALIAARIIEKPLTPASLPADFLQSEDEYVQAVLHLWGRCAHSHVAEKENTSHPWLLIKYIISGGTATVVDLGLLFFFTEVFQLWYVLSALFAYACAFEVSFTLQKFWTFRDGTLQRIHTQFFFYVGLGTFNMLLNAGALYLLVENTGLHYLPAQFCIGVLIALWSFFCYRILFRKAVS